VAVLTAAEVSNRSDWPHWDAMVGFGVLLMMLASAGTACYLADPPAHWGWVAAGAFFSVAGVWAGVPETGPAVLVGGSFTGLFGIAALTRASLAPSAGVGMAVALGWAAMSGAAGRPWATIGGVLCMGVAPWLAFRPLLPTLCWTRSGGRRLLGAHVVLVILAARWIGVVPQAGWPRVAALIAGGLAVATATQSRA